MVAAHNNLEAPHYLSKGYYSTDFAVKHNDDIATVRVIRVMKGYETSGSLITFHNLYNLDSGDRIVMFDREVSRIITYIKGNAVKLSEICDDFC